MRFCSCFLLACCSLAQVATTTPATAMPTVILGGFNYNQQTGFAGWITGAIPESSNYKLYATVTADLIPTKIVDPTTGKTVRLVSGSLRGGQHRIIYQDPRNTMLVGGDLGATWVSSGAPPVTSNGFATSFTATYIHMFGNHFGVALPIRMIWMSGAGPDGRGAFNPILELGFVWKP